jgi:hypothetical protein
MQAILLKCWFLWEHTAMNKAGNKEQFDADILQCKVDILRARNITPDDAPLKKLETQKSATEVPQSFHKDTNPIPIEEIPAKQAPPLPGPKKEAETSPETPEIPSFDLAEEIMAEQRKVTAVKRKAPGKKTEAQGLKPVTRIDDHSIEKPKLLLSEQDKIIAEIVARDIEKLCRGNCSNEQRL